MKYLHSSDYTSISDRPILEVKIYIQQPPRLVDGAPTIIEIKEDSEPVYVDLNKIFEDPDGDEMVFSIWLNGWSTGPFESENVTISIEPNNTLLILPRENQFGSDVILLKANDTQEEAPHTLTVRVLSVNDVPELRPIRDRKGVQGAWLNFSIRATDVDIGQENTMVFGSNVTDNEGDGLAGFTTMSIKKNEFDPQRADVSYLPENSHVGDFRITFWVRDHLDAEDNASVKFSIKNKNDPPEIYAVQVSGESTPEPVKKDFVTLVAKQDEWLNFTVLVDDPDIITPDGEVLQFWTNISNDDFILNSKNGNVSFMALNKYVGYFYVKMFVRDYEGSEDWADIRIKVNNKPDPPVITGVTYNGTFYENDEGDIVLDLKYGAVQDQYFNFTVEVFDNDLGVDKTETMRFRTNRSLDFNFALDTRSGEVEFFPTQEEVGWYVVKVIVMDVDENEDFVTISIKVKDVNDLPPKPDFSIAVIDEEDLIINAIVPSSPPIIDPDGDTVTCIWDFGDGTEPDIKVKFGEKWTARHTYEEPGVYLVTLTLDDGRGGFVSRTKSIQVGEVIIDDDIPEPTSVGTGDRQVGSQTDYGLILSVMAVVIVVLIIAVLFYIRTGKKYIEEEEEEEEDIIDGDMGIPEMLGLGATGPMYQQMAGLMPGGMFGQYPGFGMYQQQMMQPGLPPMGSVFATPGAGAAPAPPTTSPQLMLPPATSQPANICPQCEQPTIQFLTPDVSSFQCTSCGYQV
jgi:hypothetical protein